MQYTVKSRSRIKLNRIEITVKLANYSVLCCIKIPGKS